MVLLDISFVPACIIIFSGVFRKLGLICSKISFEDVPGYYRILTLMFSFLFTPLSWNMESLMISVCDAFSGIALLIWFFDFFTSLVIWFYWRTILFNYCDLYFYCIYTVIFIWIIYTLGFVKCNFGWNLRYWGSV